MWPSPERRFAIVVALALVATGAAFLVRPGGTPRAHTAEAGPRHEPPGWAAAFATELKKLGQISPQEFAQHYAPKSGYLDRLSWDPTTARFFDQVMLDPEDPAAHVRARGKVFTHPGFTGKKDAAGRPVVSAK